MNMLHSFYHGADGETTYHLHGVQAQDSPSPQVLEGRQQEEDAEFDEDAVIPSGLSYH